MAKPFQVEANQINRLDALLLTKLLKLLLHLEARKFGIAERHVEVGLNIIVADGGEDGRIAWQGGIDSTSFIPARLTQFQCKATDMPATECAKELVNDSGALKPMIEEVMEAGGTYLLFTTQIQNGKQKAANIEAMRKKLRDLGKPYADTINIVIYDAGLIAGWVNQYISAVTSVQYWIGEPSVSGLKTFTHWGQHPEYSEFEFKGDPERLSAIDALRSLLIQPRKVARCIGLSGLGKTRLAYEVFNVEAIGGDLHTRVVYVDSAANNSILGIVTDWIQFELEGIVVVDNCDASLHNNLRNEVLRQDSKLSLLTLDFNLEKVVNTEVILLKPLGNEFIQQMLAPVYEARLPDLHRIVGFAEGYPQMAVLLAQSRLDKSDEMGSVSDETLVHKLLWGSGKPEGVTLKILRGCALFEKFGLADDASAEFDFIAENVLTGITKEDFYECIRRFEERGLIDRRGRYCRLVPKPLAIWLAAQWWRRTNPAKCAALVATDMPMDLLESFCEQTTKLDFLPEVQKLVEDICEQRGPFGQAEVILSLKGSRLFRAFVEVNPKATSNALRRVLNALSHEQLLSIDGNVRRNLVYALERLCFHVVSFTESAWSLALLASAENETWSNNATGHWKQLFRVHLSGTAAPPSQRKELIKQLLNKGSDSFMQLIVMALDEALSTHGHTRTVGAEYQGSKQPLEEWKPQIWQEIFDYWAWALGELTEIALSTGEIANLAKAAIASNIRGLMQNGRINELDAAINAVVTAHGPLWLQAREAVQTSIEFDSEKMPKEGVAILEKWITLLTPQEISERLVFIVSMPPYQHEERDDKFFDVSAENATNFAIEFKDDITSLVPYFYSILVGEQRQAYQFGKSLVEASGQWQFLLHETLQVIQRIEQPNLSFLMGQLNALYAIDSSIWESVIYEVCKDTIVKEFPWLLITGKATPAQLHHLIHLVEKNEVSISAVGALSHALSHLSVLEMSEWAIRLATVSPEASWQALNIIYSYTYSDRERFDKCKEAIVRLLSNLQLAEEIQKPRMAFHAWGELAKKLLNQKNELDLAKSISDSIIVGCIKKIGHSDLRHSVDSVLRLLLRNYGDTVWHQFAAAIKDADAMKRFFLKELFDNDFNVSGQKVAVISELPIQVLSEWCVIEPGVGPAFLARTTETIATPEEEPLAALSQNVHFLLDNFGSDEAVLQELSANFGTFGWSGSLVPFFERQKNALEPLLSHQNESVRNWVVNRLEYLKRNIEREASRDAEHDWGIY